ncbi:tetratricopeptide repeat-containing sensor histidine kinase [Arsenicibacter rosenii]|uniref:histidine kinase n=1 Tax=Arsenicibacter rosenii TaxID=1750698 RepID=A0A1S2VK32_9BACT|nr:tetratricopeptide repeat-containing sensor histidine kinase [Arsenicibacter rosenii]OIN59114.1 two-component sensor histidine kinase [Arsenicibacter rosenii]
MKKLLLFFCLLTLNGFAKTPRPDSLKRVLATFHKQRPGHTRDTLLYLTMKELMIYYDELNMDSSLHYSDQLIKFCQHQKLDRGLLYAYLYAGYLYSSNRNFYQSIDIHYKALTLAKKLKQYTRLARSYGGLAHAYLGLGKYEVALRFGKQGLVVLREHPDADTQASILNDLGAIYREQGRLADALKVNDSLYSFARKQRLQWHEAQGLQAIGWVYKEMGDMAQALAYNKKGLLVIRQQRGTDLAGRTNLEANILANIAGVYIRMKQWPQALDYCRQAKQTALNTRNGTVLAESEEQRYKIFKNTGQLGNALTAYEHYIVLKDSLAKETTDQRIERLSAQYKYEQSQNELLLKQNKLYSTEIHNEQLASGNRRLVAGLIIILVLAVLLLWNNRRLQAKNREIEQQRVLIEAARKDLADINQTLENRVDERTKELVNANLELIQKNEEIKAALFKGQTIERKRVALELHDNLSSLLSAVNMSMQSINPKNLPESEIAIYQNVKHLIQNAYTEVRNISHNILPAELEQKGLPATLTTLIDKLNQSTPLRFSLTITGIHDRLPVKIEYNVYIIVFELINNAIRHAQATRIIISLIRSNLGLDLSVRDDGIGMGQHHPKRGIGLQNIQTRLDTLGGILTFIQPLEKGTWINIKIPIETFQVNGEE